MKNLKKIAAMMVLVTVMGVSSTFAGGVYLTDRQVSNDEPVPTTPTCTNNGPVNGGVILGGVILGGVILGGVILGGVILGGVDSADDTPCVLGTQD